jgi:hypothetical protein
MAVTGKKISLILAAPILALSFASPAIALNACEPVFAEIFSNLDTSNRTVTKSETLKVFAGSGLSNDSLSEYETWYSFDNCKGNLVISVDKDCGFPRTYTRGTCTIKDVPNY